MYPLGRQFENDITKAKCDKKVVVQGKNYRISVLTERVVRLEYSSNGQFNDKPTQIIKRRNFSLPDFSVMQDNSIVQINTRYFNLSYIKVKSIIFIWFFFFSDKLFSLYFFLSAISFSEIFFWNLRLCKQKERR